MKAQVLLPKVFNFSFTYYTNKKKFKPGDIGSIEGIELMRALENNLGVGTFHLKGESMAIDIKKDILKVKKAMKKDRIRKLY